MQWVPMIAYIPVVHPAAAGMNADAAPLFSIPHGENVSGDDPRSDPQQANEPGDPTVDGRRLNPTLPLILYPILVFGLLPWMHGAPSAPPYGASPSGPPSYHAPYGGAPPGGPPAAPKAPWFW